MSKGSRFNRGVVSFHLKEAKEELDRTIAELANDPKYSPEAFQIAMSHLYHHLNTAWNGQKASPERHRKCSEEDFNRWRKFPTNAELLLD